MKYTVYVRREIDGTITLKAPDEAAAELRAEVALEQDSAEIDWLEPGNSVLEVVAS